MHVSKVSATIKLLIVITIIFIIGLSFYIVTALKLTLASDIEKYGKPHIITIIVDDMSLKLHHSVMFMYIALKYGVDAVLFRKPPNIVVLMADDLGWNDVSFHGSNEIPTPNIDSLAYNGVILDNHYVLPVCTPSRTAFFTGRYPIRAGMQGFPLRAGEPRGIPLDTSLLPEHLQKLGYATRLVGKWHLGYYSDDFTPARRGFETFYGYYSGYITYFNHTITQSGQTGYDLHRDTPAALSADWSRRNQYATDVFTDEAVKIIEQHSSHQPLYLQISHIAPHASDADERLETRDPAEVNRTFYYIDDLQRRKYAGMVTAMDESVGRVMGALSERNMLKNSIVVFMSDNGAQTVGLHENRGSNYPLRGLKFTLYEGGVHGVACVYSPLIRNPGRIVNDLVHMTDWLPTLYAAAGGSVADLGVIDGVNQWPTISRGTYSARDSLLVNIDEVEHLEAAIVGQYKLLKGAIPLYDGYFGANVDDDDPSAPAYDVQAVMSSPASRAIFQTTRRIATPRKMLQLRARSKITCRPFTEFANCSDRCLFDLDVDPCETTDISGQHPDLVETLENFINGYRTVLMNQTNAPVDPNSFPQHFNGTWMPWIETDRTV